MKTINYPPHLYACSFCGSKKIALRSTLVRDSNSLKAIFKIECLGCGYETKECDNPAIASHVWNLSKKLEVANLIKLSNNED